MAAFPELPTSNALRLRRDELRVELARLKATVELANKWVEDLEADRIPLDPADEVAYDAARVTQATSLRNELRNETSLTSVAGLYRRVHNTLNIQAKFRRFTASTQAAMLALNASIGDEAIRTDLSQTFILIALPATDINNWTT